MHEISKTQAAILLILLQL